MKLVPHDPQAPHPVYQASVVNITHIAHPTLLSSEDRLLYYSSFIPGRSNIHTLSILGLKPYPGGGMTFFYRIFSVQEVCSAVPKEFFSIAKIVPMLFQGNLQATRVFWKFKDRFKDFSLVF